MAGQTPKLETDMYPPIRDHLVAQGFEVRAEVMHCDVTAQKDGQLIVIEMKRRFEMDLLYQAIERQSVCESVYVALPGLLDLGRRSAWRKRIKLLKRLELGLILVDFDQTPPQVRIIHHPVPSPRRKISKKTRAVLLEAEGRSGDYNQGGEGRRKLMTAYRETSLYIACCLEKLGQASPAQLRALGAGSKTLSILNNNHYNWFIRTARGVYALTADGRDALDQFPRPVKACRKKLAIELEKQESKDE